MKEPAVIGHDQLRKMFPGIDEAPVMTANTSIKEEFDYAENVPEPGIKEPNKFKPKLNFEHTSDNILEHIANLEETRDSMLERLGRIDDDINTLYEYADEQGIYAMGNYRLNRSVSTRRTLIVSKFAEMYPEIFEKFKKATPTDIAKAIGMDRFQEWTRTNFRPEYDSVARVTISDVKNEVGDANITECCKITETVKLSISKI
jgi:hypothetical protein